MPRAGARNTVRSGRWLAVMVAALAVSAPSVRAENHRATLLGHLDAREVYKDVWGYHAPDGTEIAIVGTSLGTQFVDVTDPTAPVELLFLAGPPSGWRDIKTYGTYAYIVVDNNSNEALQIVDLADPLHPVKVAGGSEFFRRSHNLFVDGSTLYAVGTDRAQGYVALDLSDPVHPTLLGTFADFYFHDIYVENGLAYAAQVYNPAFLAILDVRDPAHPEVLSRVPYDGA
ncbi:MAG: hypothetical protein KC729_19270, partial [Candidatus Eisenbacteria bacterium]|nr:hypothetical protein [Candidatus Eisenbacteria bacterium]